QIWNTTRSSLHFQVPGRSVRLAPGQSMEIDKAYLGTSELQVLCDRGAVRRSEPSAPAPTPAAAPPPLPPTDTLAKGAPASEPADKPPAADEAKTAGDAKNLTKKKSS